MMQNHSSFSGMLPYDTTNAAPAMGLYEQAKPRFIFKMPRVVPDQKSKFESDEIFRRLSRESEIRYTGYRDRPLEERKIRFQNACREGHTEIAFITTGTNLQLIFTPSMQNNPYASSRQPECDFDKDPSKVSIRSSFIMNGVCVRFKGWLDLERLDGSGCLEFDEEQADAEDSLLRDQIDRYNQRLRDFENKQRLYSHNQIEIDGRMSNSSLQNINATGTTSRCHNSEATTLHRQNLSMGISLSPPQ